MRVGDIECDGLLDELTKLHCYVDKAYKKNEFKVFCNHSSLSQKFKEKLEERYNIEWFDEKDLRQHLENIGCICIHNLFGYDLQALKKLGIIDSYSMKPENINGNSVRLIDTLSMSRTLYPDRPLPVGCPTKVYNPVTGKMDTVGSHGLAAWGYRVSNMKPTVNDWRNQPLDVYVERCIEDVVINDLTLEKLIKESLDICSGENIPKIGLKSDWKAPLRLNNKQDYLMSKQEEDGILFDIEAAENLLVYIDETMGQLAKEVEKNLPLRELPKSQQPTFPAKPLKADGDISADGWRWLKKLGYEINEEYFNLPKIPSKPFKGDGTLSVQGERFCSDNGFVGTLEEKKLQIQREIDRQKKIVPLDGEILELAKRDLINQTMPSILVPMEISNQQDIKKYLFLEEGWQPTIWNTKDVTRDQSKRALKESEQQEKLLKYIEDCKESIYKEAIEEEMEIKFSQPTEKLLDKLKKKARYLVNSPKFKDERGELCPSLLMLQGDMAKKIVKWLSLRNRRSVIKTKDEKKETGWLNNKRLLIDGRIGQGNSGITNTNRYKHREIVNLPKADPSVLLGKEMRSLFIAPEGKKILGYDGSNLEQFVAGSYAWMYDGGVYAESLKGDSHTTNAKAYSLACGREVTRSQGKNITYAILYGAQAAKISKMLGVSRNQAQKVIDAFWDTNYGLKSLKTNLEKYWENTGKKYIRGIDGRKIFTRSKHSLVNALFQSCGATLMSISGCYMYDMLISEGLLGKATRIAYVHDEYQYEIDEDIIEVYEFNDEQEAKDFRIEGKLLSNPKKVRDNFVRYYCRVGELGNLSLKKAGEYLNMPLPFNADYDIGNNLAETH